MRISLMKETRRTFSGNSEHAAMCKAENFLDEMFYTEGEEWKIVKKEWRVRLMFNSTYVVTVAKVEPHVKF